MSDKIQILYNKLKFISDEYTDTMVSELDDIPDDFTVQYGDFHQGEVIDCLKELLTWFGRDYSYDVC